MRTIRRAGAAALAAVLLTSCTSASAPAPAPSPSPTADLAALRVQYGLPDCPATDATAEAIDGGLPATDLQCLGSDTRVNLAGLPRVPTVVNVWAQWCGPCREEAPYLREMLAERGDVAFVGINYNDPLPDWAIEFAGLVGWIYPHVMDQDKTLQVPLRIPGVPASYFISADGKIAGVHAGAVESTAQLRALMDEHLGAA